MVGSRLLGGGQRLVTEHRTAEAVVTNEQSIVDEFSKYFSTLSGELNGDIDENVGRLPECGHEFHFKRVEEDEC